MKKILSILLIAFSFCCTALAQKEVVVSEAKPHLELLGGKPDVDTYDLRLCISFNEDANTLQVSLSSTNSDIFGFKHNVVYGNVFRHRRRLGFEKLPYKVDFDPATSLRMSRGVKKQMKPNVKKHNVKPWLEYDGMEAQKAEEMFPSDSLVQTFKLDPSTQSVNIRLRECFVIERKGSTGRRWNKFSMNYLQNLSNEYVVVVKRNPCRKLAGQIDSVQTMHRILSIACKQLSIGFPDGKAKTLQELESFQMLRNDLLKTYPKMNTDTACPDLARVAEEYNICVDSLLNMTCTIPDEFRADVVKQLGSGIERVDADGLLYCSRMLDDLVAEWQMEKNKTARLSIIQQCNKIIDNGTAMAIGRRVVTDADRKALEVFAQAKEHFRKTCR